MNRLPLPLVAAALALSLNLPAAVAIGPDKGGQETAGNEGTKVTGTVMKVDQSTGEITIDDQTYQLLLGAGAGLEPQVGAKVTALLRGEGRQEDDHQDRAAREVAVGTSAVGFGRLRA
jgi:hypothetical protein